MDKKKRKSAGKKKEKEKRKRNTNTYKCIYICKLQNSDKSDSIDMTVVDFDGVTYEVKTPNKKTEIYISIRWICFQELVSYGAQQILEREYGQYLASTPEPNYDATLIIDVEQIPSDEGKIMTIIIITIINYI